MQRRTGFGHGLGHGVDWRYKVGTYRRSYRGHVLQLTFFVWTLVFVARNKNQDVVGERQYDT